MEAIAEAPELLLPDVVVAEAIESMMMATIGASLESMVMETCSCSCSCVAVAMAMETIGAPLTSLVMGLPQVPSSD